jgi:hypothetical protein
MITAWQVSLQLARDDGGSLSDDGIRQLTDRLTDDGVLPVLFRPHSGTVVVRMRIDASSDRSARSAAEILLQDRAHDVWVALGLPPFTITFVDARQEA